MEWISNIHLGKVRENQEDFIGHWPTKSPILFALADGMGGHPNGEDASKLAVESLLQDVVARKGLELSSELKRSVLKAHQALWAHNKKLLKTERMGTTLTSLYFKGRSFFIAHVGDSRVYLIRKKKIVQLTKDHSLDAYTLTQALGLEKQIKIDRKKGTCKEGDIFLVSSDGLHGLLDNEKIMSLIKGSEDLTSASEALLNEALNAGGHDNISFFILKV